LRLRETATEDSWPRRLVYPSAGELRELLDERLPDYQLLLDGSEPDGYLRAWRPYGLEPERHLAYAVQWYGLAAAAAGIWLAVTLKRRRMRDAD
jgi:surfeit locus 1 family protein